MEHKVYKIKPQISSVALAKARQEDYDIHSLPDLFFSTNKETKKKYQGCRIVDFKIMPIDQVKKNLTKTQCRVQTLDQKHVNDLTKQIKEEGKLLKPLIAEMYNAIPNTADGHHRWEGCKANDHTHVPVWIIEFDTPLNRSQFQRKANNHLPAKAGTKDDATNYLDELHTSHDFFGGLTDKQKTTKAYEELKDAFGHLGSQTLSGIVRKWSKTPGSQMKFDTRKSTSWQKKVTADHKTAGKKVKWGQLENGEINVFFQDNGISQCLGQIIDLINDEVSRLKGLRCYTDEQIANKISNIKIITHGAIYTPQDHSLNTRRNEVAQKWESYNKNNVVNFMISQINWQAQQLQPVKEQAQILAWDFTEEKFI
jgi:hypothetical protein